MKSGNVPKFAHDWIVQNYSRQLADVFFSKNTDGSYRTNTRREQIDKDHEHMKRYNKPTFDNVKKEHKEDDEKRKDC